jgi:hypothetical protein
MALISVLPFILICVIGLITIFVLYKLTKTQNNNETIDPIQGRKSKIKDFIISNYLPKHKIKIDVLNQKSNITEVLCKEINPLSNHGISKEKADKYIVTGNVIKIYIINKNSLTSFADYIIDTAEKTRIKSLKIGMITTRYIGGTDSFRNTAVSGATIGAPWVNIYNFSKIPLIINELIIPPLGIYRHKGYQHRGIPLGTIFTDTTKLSTHTNENNVGVFPEYEYTRPYNSLIYGVTSDLEQPLNGDWQLEFSDIVSYEQTLWPLIDGQY